MLGDARDQWQALVFGMTCRIYPDPMRCNPRPLWAALDALGLGAPQMIGWWDPACPVRIRGEPNGDVRATVFVGGRAGASRQTVAIAIASWAPVTTTVTLEYDWAGLAAFGFGEQASQRAWLHAVAIEGFQPAGKWEAGGAITLQAKGSAHNEGWLLQLKMS